MTGGCASRTIAGNGGCARSRESTRFYREIGDAPAFGRLHAGPCIAVTQNERLGYFGSTVNLAARLVDLSSGTNIVVSSAVADDPEVADLLAEKLRAERVEAILKGFEDEQFEVWSVT